MTKALRDAAQALLDRLDGRRSFGVELLAAEFAAERKALSSALAAPIAEDAELPPVAWLYTEDGRFAGEPKCYMDEAAATHACKMFDGKSEPLVRQRDALAATSALQADLAERDARIADMRKEWGEEAATLTSQAQFQSGVAEALKKRVSELTAQARHTEDCLEAAKARIAELEAKLNTPQLHDFAQAVVLEAAHQRERWGVSHDAGKDPSDWFWLVGYLAGKALHAATSGNNDKTAHHTISTAAALANWHAHVTGEYTAFRPGIDPVARGIEPATSKPSGEA